MDTGKMLESLLPTLISYGIRVLGVLLAFWIAAWIARAVQRLVTARMTARGVEQTLSLFAGNVARYTILIATGIACLGVFGIETTSFAAILGAAGLAIGLAFQGTLSNFAAGVMLVVFRPFKVGDVISVAGQTGTVAELGIFVTALDTPDNRRIILPNKAVSGGVIENITHHEERRVDIDVGVDYGADLAKTRESLEAAAKALEGVIEPGVQIVLGELGDSAIGWKVRIWCRTEDYWDVRERALDAVKTALDSAGIPIPFPQMDVHIDGSVERAA